MGEDTEFRSLLARFREGDPDAAEYLCRWYAPVIRGAVRRHLDERLRTLFDSLDFVQDVWVSVLATPPGRYTIETPRALSAFLTRVAHDKMIDALRRHTEARMARGSRESATPDPDRTGLDELPSSDPAPDQWAIAGERWEQLRESLRPVYRAVAERLRDGYTYDEIARMVGVSPRTIKRIVGMLKERAGP